MRPPISSPRVTAALEASSTTRPAARLVIQKRCSVSMAGQDWAVVTARWIVDRSESPDAVDRYSTPWSPRSTCRVAAVARRSSTRSPSSPIEPSSAITPQARTNAARVRGDRRRGGSGRSRRARAATLRLRRQTHPPAVPCRGAVRRRRRAVGRACRRSAASAVGRGARAAVGAERLERGLRPCSPRGRAPRRARRPSRRPRRRPAARGRADRLHRGLELGLAHAELVGERAQVHAAGTALAGPAGALGHARRAHRRRCRRPATRRRRPRRWRVLRRRRTRRPF